MTQPPGPQGPYQPFPQGPGQQGQPHHGGGYPQQQGYPQQGGYPHQQGFDPYGQQKKSPLPWILGGIGALVVIGGAVTAIILLTGDDEGGEGGGGGTSTPQAAAASLASAINAKDVDAVLGHTCAEFRSQIGGNKADLQEDLGELSNVTVKNVRELGADKAEVTMTAMEQGETQPEDEQFTFTKRDGRWVWCESVPAADSSTGSEPGGAGATPAVPPSSN